MTFLSPILMCIMHSSLYTAQAPVSPQIILILKSADISNILSAVRQISRKQCLLCPVENTGFLLRVLGLIDKKDLRGNSEEYLRTIWSLGVGEEKTGKPEVSAIA